MNGHQSNRVGSIRTTTTIAMINKIGITLNGHAKYVGVPIEKNNKTTATPKWLLRFTNNAAPVAHSGNAIPARSIHRFPSPLASRTPGQLSTAPNAPESPAPAQIQPRSRDREPLTGDVFTTPAC